MKTIQHVIAAVATAALCGGCVTTRSVPDVGVRGTIMLLQRTPPLSCGEAAKYAASLQYFGTTLRTNEIRDVVAVLKDGNLCERARIELVRVLEDAHARSCREDLLESLERVGDEESELADELSALIIAFSASREEVFAFVTKQVNSTHVPVRYGCIDLLHAYFKPGENPALANQIVSILIERARGDTDAAVTELACAALGQFGLSLDTNRAGEILDTLETISNDLERKYETKGHRFRNLPRRSESEVRQTAVEYARKMRAAFG